MNTKLCYTSIFSLLSLCLSAQTVIVGTVKTTKGEAVSDATITLKTLPDSAIVGYDFSENDGRFRIQYQGMKENLLLEVKSMTIKSQIKQIVRKDQTVDFIVEEAAVQLKEVIVKSVKIWEQQDTINYMVAAFSDSADINIGDVLRKMPGISILESGAIYYQGKPINKFYVENMDLLGGRYGIAAKTIPAKSVSTVQILENHQPIKVLSKLSIHSTDPAINLKLKEEAKGIWSIMGTLGGGTPRIWDNELAGTYFAKKQQNIITFKSNNAGVDLADEMQMFEEDSKFGRTNLLTVNAAPPPSIKKNRYLFNNSNAITFNHLLKLKNDAHLRLNLLYLNNYERQNSYSRTAYILPKDSLLIINENMRVAQNTDNIEAELNYTLNTNDSYINNKLNVKSYWTRYQNFILTEDSVKQQLTNTPFSLTNELSLIKHSSEQYNGYELTSTIGVNSSPQTLVVTPGLYKEFFNYGNTYNGLLQESTINTFQMNNNVQLFTNWKIGNFGFDPSFNNTIEYKTLHSDIYTLPENGMPIHNAADSMRNDLSRLLVAGQFSVAVRYNPQQFYIEIILPLKYNFLLIDNRLDTDNKSLHKIYFQPKIQTWYDINRRWKVSGSYRLYKGIGDLPTLYAGYILEGYRRLNHYNNTLAETQTDGGSVGFEYKEIMNMLFVNGGVNYNHTQYNLFYGQSFDGILTTINAIERPNSSNNLSFNGKISKGYDWKKLSLALSGMYGIARSEQLRQGKILRFSNQMINTVFSTNMTLAKWLLLSYDGVWHQSWSATDNGQAFEPIRMLRHIVSGKFILPQNVMIGISHENYYNSAIATPYLSFTDIEIRYAWHKFNLSLNCNNIFNKKEYVSAYYSDITSYMYAYEIRNSSIMLKVQIRL